MFYFNPFSYFFKSFIRLFTKKFFWVILILLLICIGWALYDKGVFAISPTGSGEYGNYSNMSSEVINKLDVLIAQYKGDFDSFIARPVNNNRIEIKFYNSSYSGKIFKAYYNNTLTFTSDPNLEVVSNNNVVCDLNGNFISLTTSSPQPFVYIFNNAFYTNMSVYNDNTFSSFYFESFDNYISFVSPYIENESSVINNWSFDYLHINSGSETIYYNNVLGEQTTATLYLDYVYNDIRYRYQIPSNLYGINTNDTFDIYIPRTSLLNNVNITNDSNVSFYLGVRKNTESVFPLGSYTFALTTEQEEQIQQDSDKALQGEILGAQQETNNKLDNIENTITDTTVPDDSEFDLPTIEVNDSTANFFDTLFTGIYNAFNTNEDTTISFTIFSKTITINSADFRMLNDNRFTILRNLLESSWYFAIGYMILKDIRHIFDKIKTGNIENAVSNDIKADMV